MEEYLHDACQASPLIDFRWGNKVVKVEQMDGYALATVDTPEGEYRLETDWLVDASGGRSVIRSAMELQMEGASYEGFFVIADIRSTCRCRPSAWPTSTPTGTRQHHPDAPQSPTASGASTTSCPRARRLRRCAPSRSRPASMPSWP